MVFCRFLLLVLMTVIFVACTATNAPETQVRASEPTAAELESSLQSVVTDLNRAHGAGQIDELMDLFAESAILLPPGEEVVSGLSAIRVRLLRDFEQFVTQADFKAVDTRVQSGLASLTGYREGSRKWRDGRPDSRIREKAQFTFVYQEDAWKIQSWIWNRVLETPSTEAASINFILQHGSLSEQTTADTLMAMIGEYDLSKWAYTKTVMVNDNGQYQAKPILSLTTRHRHQRELLLSQYLNAQLRWLLSFRPVETQAAIQELRRMYPQPEGGIPTEIYASLLAGYLEYQALTELLGHEAAFRALAHWTLGDEAWVYTVVLADASKLGEVVNRHDLNY